MTIWEIGAKLSHMKRILESSIRSDLEQKLVLLSGPRQVGKTTLARQLYSSESEYLNYDSSDDRKAIKSLEWRRDRKLVIFDELHKMTGWKRWLKGIYDTEGFPPSILVTGSARMDVYRQGGESLAGRHFLYRLHPLSICEVQRCYSGKAEEIEEQLLRLGGFPEPFLKGEDTFAKRWRRNHIDRILREDLLDLEKVREIKSIEILVDLLAERVGSTTSFSSLARDLEVSPKTVKHWIEILQRMFVVFIVSPYSRNIARAILKEPKIYFYDIARVKDRGGARLENLAALSLLKRNQFLEDTQGERMGLFYIRDRQKREVDFLTLRDQEPEWLIEVKENDPKVSPSLKHFLKSLPGVQPIQISRELRKEFDTKEGIHVRKSAPWLAELES